MQIVIPAFYQLHDPPKKHSMKIWISSTSSMHKTLLYAITVNPVPSKYMYPQGVLIQHNSLRNDAKSKYELKKKKKKKKVP